METSAALADDLRTLSDALDPPHTDLDVLLQGLIADLRITAASYLGLTVSIVSGAHTYTISTFDDVPRARSSASLPLWSLCTVEPGSSLVLYASAQNAFVGFADEVSAALGLPRGAIALDSDLVPPARTPGLSEVAVRRQINQAIGILIERGYAPVEAAIELERLAAQQSTTVTAVAARLARGVGT